jgi:DNA-binding MarR family transcriptional regulator
MHELQPSKPASAVLADSVMAPVTLPADHREAVVRLRQLVLTVEELRHALELASGLSYADLLALTYLGTEGSLSPGELAQRLSLTPSSITVRVDRLTADGYVIRKPHERDRRRQQLTLTPAGKRALTRARDWGTAAVHRLDHDRLPVINSVLSEVIQALTQQIQPNAAGEASSSD